MKKGRFCELEIDSGEISALNGETSSGKGNRKNVHCVSRSRPSEEFAEQVSDSHEETSPFDFRARTNRPFFIFQFIIQSIEEP
jgi:hypothetical protein